MKRLLSILFLLTAFAIAGQAQTGCVELKEIDGSPDVKCVKTIRVTNGTLSCSGNVCTITISGGGGGTPGGSDTQLQYNNAGSFGGITGATTNGTVVTLTSPVLVTPAIGVATGTSLTVTGNMQVGIAALYKFGGSNSLSYTDSTGPKFTDGNTTRDLIFNVQSLSANRTVTWPDASGTATLLGNSSTGSGAVVLTGTPTIATPSFTTGFTIGGTAATGTIPRGNGTNFVASAFTMASPGTSGNVLTSDGTNWTSAAPAGGGITIGTTTITSGTNTRVLFNNSGVAGEYAITGTGNVMMSASPTTTGRLTAADANFVTAVTTGSAGTAGFQITADSLTTGNGHEVTSSSVTSGNVVRIAATGTAAASNTKTALSVSTSGANATSTQTTFGATFSNTSTGTSSTNIAAQFTASGGSNNRAISVTAGQVILPTGVNSAPSIANANATNYGIYFPGDTSVSVSIAGTATWAILSGRLTMVSGAQIGITSAAADPTANNDTGWARQAAAVWRATNGSTGAGSVVLGTSTVGSIGTSGVGVLAIANGTAPSSSPADEFQLYSADSAAGDANAFARNEAGEINRLTGLAARNSSSFVKTSDTTLANITGLTRNVEAGRTYAFTATLQTTAAATGGVKFAVSGTATATSISYEGVLVDTAVGVVQTRATALDTTVCASTTSTTGTCTIKGVIVVNAAGTLTIQFAQNASDGGASTVLVNQYMQLIPIS